MNYTQRLDEIERQMGGGMMTIAEESKWFVMWTMVASGQKGEPGISLYDYPGHEPLFKTPFTPEDWVWYDANAERYEQHMEKEAIRGRDFRR